MPQQYISLHLYHEQIAGEGEDAPPTLLLGDDGSAILAVFDGLGGAGSQPYQDSERAAVHTAAYWAARCASDALTQYYLEEWTADHAPDATALQQVFATALQHRMNALTPCAESGLRTRLLRLLPTTCAAWWVQDLRAKTLSATLFWAGDSRGYVWQAEGLRQLSRDDIGNMYPDTWKADVPLQNVLHAGADFVLHSHTTLISEPSLLLVCSDGAYDYLPSPMHLEWLLLDTLKQSTGNDEHWQALLAQTLQALAGDDISLVALGWGFSDVNSLQDHFCLRHQFLHDSFIEPYNQCTDPYAQQQFLQHYWQEYRQGYWAEDIL